ncbi:MAG: rRNA maturation RNase YbeY [Ignavibacteriales bacterium]|nr:rRNA maturation RNase YbeY [Ignavibacteriales bacterium]
MIDVVVIRDADASVRLTKKEIGNIVSFVCRQEKISGAELIFVIVNDRKIRAINKKFLHHDYITDVITFPLDMKRVNAEIYINPQQASRQAAKYGVTKKNELIRLIIHGTLHALGYDDSTPKSRERMERVQERYVSELS